MRVSYNQLKEIVDFSFSPQELAERLTNLGLEVRGTEYFGKLEKVVVGKILSIQPHPDADRIKIVKVDIGRRSISVVCGAPSIREGILVPVALEGARLRGGIRVRKVKVRGVNSPGMLCSEDELGLGKDQSGIMALPSHLSLGMSLSKALELEDIILDLEITPNRGDCLSVIGIAREIAALRGKDLHLPSWKVKEKERGTSDEIQIEIKDPELCPYYSARLIRGVKVGPSPLWLWRKILISGGKPINNIVDITNYVSWEMGQPLHAFDYGLLEGKRIIVRRAKRGESLIALDGIKRELDEDILLIADSARPIALAGVMGGEDSQVRAHTEDILLESAYFDPLSIQRTSRRTGLSTESSCRFERRVDPSGVKKALDRASLLIQTIAGGELENRVEAGKLPKEKKWTILRPSRVSRILGSRITSSRIRTILERLWFEIEEREKDWKISIPSFRPDISREIDLIEEIVRFYGYNRLKISLPSLGGEETGEDSEEQTRETVREVLKGLGFYEVIASPFSGEDVFKKANLSPGERIRVRNPLSSEQEFLTTHLFPHLLKVASYNLAQSIEQLRIFELADVFQKIPSLKETPWVAGLILEKNFDFFSLKGIVESLLEGLGIEGIEFSPSGHSYLSSKQRASVKKEGVVLGILGRLREKVGKDFELPSPTYLFEVDFSSLLSFSRKKKRFNPLPKFPSLRRDLALVVKEKTPAEKVREGILRGGKWLEKVELFDFYRGEGVSAGYKGLAFSLTFRAPDRTLRDEEVDEIQQNVVKLLKNELGVNLRS